MRNTYKIKCRNCGEVFETQIAAERYCPKSVCQENKRRRCSNQLPLPNPGEDMPLGIIAEIMNEEKITYTQYTQNRAKYIARWRNRGE